jgi:hypothetical protein
MPIVSNGKKFYSHEEVEKMLDAAIGPAPKPQPPLITNESITPELVASRIGTELQEDEMCVLIRNHYMIETTFGVGPVILKNAKHLRH